MADPYGGVSGALHLRRIAAALGSSAVMLGAYGAHGLHDRLSSGGKLEDWRTAVLYQLFNATAILGIAALEDCSHARRAASEAARRAPSSLVRAGQVLGVGSTLFSGSIYLLCLGVGPKAVLGPTTPVGGLLMIGGWVMLGIGNL